MNAIISMLAVAIQHQSAEEVARQMFDLARDNEKMRQQRDEWRGKYESLLTVAAALERQDAVQPKQPQNRVLTLEEAQALPRGNPVYLECRLSDKFCSYCKPVNGGLMDDNGFKWRDWLTQYNKNYRVWSIGKPTHAESASIKWEGDPE